MEIQLLNTGDDPRKITKTYTTLKTTQATPYGEFTVQKPVLKLSASEWLYGNCNYVYIPDFLRYYYVVDVTVNSGKYLLISCVCDVLMTYASDILASSAVCVRNENAGINNIKDDKLPILPNKQIECIEFNQNESLNLRTATDTSLNFVINVSGGAQVTPDPE